ncbi:MAG: SAF domain-containing protein [Anaerolineales bacterium]
MRRSRIFILLAIILLLGAAAAYLFLVRPDSGAEGEATPPPVDVVFVAIAAQDISRGAKVPEDGVIMSRMNANLVVETMISGQDEDEIRSRIVDRIARQDIARGVPLTEAMLTDTSGDLLAGGSNAALAIPAGYTAIAIPMNRLSGIAYAMQDGDVVDILISLLLVDLDPDFQTILPNQTTPLTASGGTAEFPAPNLTGGVTGVEVSEAVNIPPLPFGKVETDEVTGQPFHMIPQEQQRPRAVSQRLVEAAIVLHVGTFQLEGEVAGEVIPVPEGGVGAPAPEGQAPAQIVEPPDIITLIVTPQEALALNWAMKVGADLTFTLRAPNDGEVTETTSVTLQYLLDTYEITVPTKLPYGMEPQLETLIIPELPNDQPPAPPQQ